MTISTKAIFAAVFLWLCPAVANAQQATQFFGSADAGMTIVQGTTAANNRIFQEGSGPLHLGFTIQPYDRDAHIYDLDPDLVPLPVADTCVMPGEWLRGEPAAAAYAFEALFHERGGRIRVVPFGHHVSHDYRPGRITISLTHDWRVAGFTCEPGSGFVVTASSR